MTRREQRGEGRCGLWDELLSAPDAKWLEVLASAPERAEDWRDLARRGGFPTPAVKTSALNSNRASRRCPPRDNWPRMMRSSVRTETLRPGVLNAHVRAETILGSAHPCSDRTSARAEANSSYVWTKPFDSLRIRETSASC